MSLWQNEKIWRLITNFWTFFLLAFVVLNFFSQDKYDQLVSPLSVIYIGVLSLFVGTKEFDRWYEVRQGRHPGEWFVLLWTIIITFLAVDVMLLGKDYKLPSEIVADYIAVLSIFAITQKSKRLYKEKTKSNHS